MRNYIIKFIITICVVCIEVPTFAQNSQQLLQEIETLKKVVAVQQAQLAKLEANHLALENKYNELDQFDSNQRIALAKKLFHLDKYEPASFESGLIVCKAADGGSRIQSSIWHYFTYTGTALVHVEKIALSRQPSAVDVFAADLFLTSGRILEYRSGSNQGGECLVLKFAY